MHNQDFMALGHQDGVSVHAAFPNPAAEAVQRRGSFFSLDLNARLIKHPLSSYAFRVHGHQWSEQGIYDGDIALIDRALTPQPIDRVVIWEDDDFRIYRQRELLPPAEAWGVVTAIIHQYRFAGSPGHDR